jgi:hypothetical protein
LFLGNGAGVVSDASAVPAGFVYNATYSASQSRRYNQIFQSSGGTGRTYNVAPRWRGLTVGTVPDPRVPNRNSGNKTDTQVDQWIQQKYTSLASPIPFASWREAQLMIAEVQQGQQAVNIINSLRATYPALPQFASTDAAAIRAQVTEERQRELWLQGNRIGDMLRLGIPFPHDVTERNEPYGEDTCVPTSIWEEVGNQNF